MSVTLQITQLQVDSLLHKKSQNTTERFQSRMHAATKYIPGKETYSAMTLVHLFVWPLVFQYLGPEDLIRVSAVCVAWWRYVFQGRKSTAKMLLECKDLDLADTGNLYQKVPLSFFGRKKMINLKGTSISSKDFLKLAAAAKQLRMLNVEGCVGITDRSLFQAKTSLRSLRSINISNNGQLSVLSVACLCSYNSLQEICARGLKLDENELLFLAKTFPKLGNGELDFETDMAGGDYFFDVEECVADFELFEEMF